jgi:hypothetical protein
MPDDYEHGVGQVRDFNGNLTTFDFSVHYDKANKPCAFVITESKENTGMKLSEANSSGTEKVADKAILRTANTILGSHNEENKNNIQAQLNGGDKLYGFAENNDGSFKQQPFEIQNRGSIFDRSANEKSISAYSPNNSSEHQPLDSVSRGDVEVKVMQFQDKNPLEFNSMSNNNRQ